MENLNLNNKEINQKKKNYYDLSHSNLMPYQIGDIVPFLSMEVLPGDEIEINTDVIGKSAPLITPVFNQQKLS